MKFHFEAHHDTMKKCFKCNESKLVTEFYRHPQMGDGHLGKRKNCTKRDVAIRAERKSSDQACVTKERERARKKTSLYRLNGPTVQPSKESKRKYYLNNKFKKAASGKLYRALRAGLIEKPDHCEMCGSSSTLQGHHHDYGRPLDVAWLCFICHGTVHRKGWHEPVSKRHAHYP